MTNEQTNTGDTGGDETPKSVEKPLSLLDEAKKVRDEIKGENDRRETILKEEQRIRANDLLGGNTGGNVKVVPKVETDKEYSDRVNQELREGKYNG